MADLSVQLQTVLDLDMTIMEVPKMISKKNVESPTFNIVMVDVSGSMSFWWEELMCKWNEIIAQNLTGATILYTFGNKIKHRRDASNLEDSDFDASSTDLTGAIHKIYETVNQRKEKYIRVFLVTDGHHNATTYEPETAINQIEVLNDKNVEVFLFGLGNSFPVEYSLTLRSKLHTGNANIPTLYWIKTPPDLHDQFTTVFGILKSSQVKIHISVPGYLAPGTEKIEHVHPGEFIYFDCMADKLNDLTLKLPEEDLVNPLKEISNPNLEFFLERVFKQWNSVLIQEHRKKGSVSLEAFEMMDVIFKKFMADLKSTHTSQISILSRVNRKKVKSYEVAYSTLLNEGKNIINLENKFSNELELAESILKTTVQTKYDTKNLKMKGYGDEDYDKDVTEFFKLFEELKSQIMSLPEPSPNEQCCITFGSLVSDLQDENLKMAFEDGKFLLMKTICIPGIPIYSPVKDSSQINVWTLRIKNILVAPFSIVSQTVIEDSANVNPVATEDKDVYLRENDESSRFNIVVPVFTENVVKVLKPLLRTNVFGMLFTFCILKNPHIIDMNAHVAALACVWMKTIADYPLENRTEFIKDRLSLIESTIKIYLGRKGIAAYCKVLIDNPNQAIMTESKEVFNNSTIKCESLVKAAFFFYLVCDKIKDSSEKKQIARLIVAEFFGRCLSSYTPTEKNSPFSDFFLKSNFKENKEEWFKEFTDKTMKEFPISEDDLLNQFFTLEDLKKNIKTFFHNFGSQFENAFEMELNMKKVKSLHNPSSTGDINLKKLNAMCFEIGLAKSDVEEILSENQILVYVFHALSHKASKDRMEKDILDYKSTVTHIKKALISENSKSVKIYCRTKLMDHLVNVWDKKFIETHKDIVKPLSIDEMINAAQQRGINVTVDTFNEVYKYNMKSGLVRNACMIEKCPFYLKPNKRFNQHIAVERIVGFPHGLHKVTKSISSTGGNAERVIEALMSGNNGSSIKRKKYNHPSADLVYPLKEQIGALLNIYESWHND